MHRRDRPGHEVWWCRLKNVASQWNLASDLWVSPVPWKLMRVRGLCLCWAGHDVTPILNCTYMYLYIYIGAYVCIYIYIHMHTCVYIYVYIYKCVYKYIHICVCKIDDWKWLNLTNNTEALCVGSLICMIILAQFIPVFLSDATNRNFMISFSLGVTLLPGI